MLSKALDWAKIFFHSLNFDFNQWFTLPLSTSCVSMTMMVTFCSQIIRQKSSRVNGKGPWVAMYSLGELYPLKNSRKRKMNKRIALFIVSTGYAHVQTNWVHCTRTTLYIHYTPGSSILDKLMISASLL